MRYSPHPPNPLLPHMEQGEPPQIRRPDAVGSPAPAQGAGLGVRATAKTLHLRGWLCPRHPRWRAVLPSRPPRMCDWSALDRCHAFTR